MINQNLLGHKIEVTDGERIWYIAELSGFLMEVDLCSKDLKCIWKIPNSVNACSYRTLFYCDNKLYIFPYYQKMMYVFDLETTEYRQIEVKVNPELMGCVKRDRFLYAYGSKSEIIKFNLEDNIVYYIDMQSQLCDSEKISCWFWINSFILDECIYIPVANTNMIMVLDSDDNVSCICLGDRLEKWVLENIQVDGGRYHTIFCKKGNDGIHTFIAEYDLNGNLISESGIEEKYAYQIYPFVNAVWSGERWICLPFGRNEILLQDKEHDEILYEISNGTGSLNDTIQGLFYCSVKTNDDTLCSISQPTGSLICINLRELSVNESKLELGEKLQCFSEKAYQDAAMFHHIINETKDFYYLESYLAYICNNGNTQINSGNADKMLCICKGGLYAESNTIWGRARR